MDRLFGTGFSPAALKERVWKRGVSTAPLRRGGDRQLQWCLQGLCEKVRKLYINLDKVKLGAGPEKRGEMGEDAIHVSYLFAFRAEAMEGGECARF